MENKTNMIPEEKLEQVSGGVSTGDLPRINPWDRACAHYECAQCGSHNVNLTGHNERCTIPRFQYYTLDSFVEAVQGMNSCWSCWYTTQGTKDPLNCSNLRCAYKG